MQFVPESVIDQILESLEETPEMAEEIFNDLNARQPELIPFLLGNNEEAFTQQEQSFLLYLLMVIWKAHLEVNGQQPVIAPEALEDAEERNWELLEQLPPSVKRFRERLDVLFESSTQEDLLAFVEDALLEDEQEEERPPVAKESREPIFVLLKTVIDCLG